MRVAIATIEPSSFMPPGVVAAANSETVRCQAGLATRASASVRVRATRAFATSGNANGIRRVEIRNFDGTLANSYTSANGVWFDPVNGGTIDTSNLIAGTSAVYFSPVPEPATMIGVSAVVGGSLMLLRRRRNSASA
jgi:hypothetical protein